MDEEDTQAVTNDQHFTFTELYFDKSDSGEGPSDKIRKIVSRNVMKCPICDYVPKKTSEIPTHLTQVHHILLEHETMIFQTEDEFYSWKIQEELRTCSHFQKVRGDKRRPNGSSVAYFKCYRSGKPEESAVARPMKKNVLKINGMCPATIKLTLKGDQLHVVYLKTHVGHENVISRIPRNPKKSKNRTIFGKLRPETNPETSDVAEIVSNRDHSKRQYQLNSDSLRVIKDYYENHQDDSTDTNIETLDEWLISNESSILFYKQKGEEIEDYDELESDDFLLVIMNGPQKEILQTYGNNRVYLQRSKKTNILGYELFSLVALDDFNYGYPCALLITNQCSPTNIKLFFTMIHENLGNSLNPKIFISDPNDIFYDCWTEVMMEDTSLIDDLKRLYCRWDVVEDWTLNLAKFIKNKERVVGIFKPLTNLMLEESVDEFNRLHKEVVESLLNEPKTKDFGVYFYEKYSKNWSSWANCILRDTPLDNLHRQIEVLHNHLIHSFLHMRNFNNLGRCIHEILNHLLKEKLIDRLLVIDEDKLEKYLNSIKDRHKNAKVFPEPLVSMKNLTEWSVSTKSVSKINCTVREISKDCDCQILCEKCKTCIHQYVCSCNDSKIKWNMCKHIHLVCLFRNRNASSRLSSGSEEIGEHNYFKPPQQPPPEDEPHHAQDLDDSENMETDSNSSQPALDLDLQKETLKNNFLNILTHVNCEEDLDIVKTHLDSLFSVLASSV